MMDIFLHLFETQAACIASACRGFSEGRGMIAPPVVYSDKVIRFPIEVRRRTAAGRDAGVAPVHRLR